MVTVIWAQEQMGISCWGNPSSASHPAYGSPRLCLKQTCWNLFRPCWNLSVWHSGNNNMQIHKYVALRRHADNYMMSIEAGLSANKSRLKKKELSNGGEREETEAKKILPSPISAFGSLWPGRLSLGPLPWHKKAPWSKVSTSTLMCQQLWGRKTHSHGEKSLPASLQGYGSGHSPAC